MGDSSSPEDGGCAHWCLPFVRDYRKISVAENYVQKNYSKTSPKSLHHLCATVKQMGAIIAREVRRMRTSVSVAIFPAGKIAKSRLGLNSLIS